MHFPFPFFNNSFYYPRTNCLNVHRSGSLPRGEGKREEVRGGDGIQKAGKEGERKAEGREQNEIGNRGCEEGKHGTREGNAKRRQRKQSKERGRRGGRRVRKTREGVEGKMK